jgi:DNA ligase (NAD+)
LLSGIEHSKTVPFESVLFGIGIRYVGKTVAEKLARHFKNIDALGSANFDELCATPEVGDKIAESVVEFFRDAGNKKEIERLKKAGLQFHSSEKEPERVSDLLANKSFVISGTFANYERDQLKDIILANGGRILSGVSAKLDFLLAGDNMGPAKMEKAAKLGVKVISEAEFEKMVAGK